MANLGYIQIPCKKRKDMAPLIAVPSRVPWTNVMTQIWPEKTQSQLSGGNPEKPNQHFTRLEMFFWDLDVCCRFLPWTNILNRRLGCLGFHKRHPLVTLWSTNSSLLKPWPSRNGWFTHQKIWWFSSSQTVNVYQRVGTFFLSSFQKWSIISSTVCWKKTSHQLFTGLIEGL